MKTPASKRRNQHSYVKKRDALRRIAARRRLPCAICGHPIDYSLRFPDPMCYTADHVEAVAAGGSMLGKLRPAHMSCNARRGARPVAEPLPKPKTHRQW